MNPFAQPKDYDEMLLKIMVFTFGISLVIVSVVAHNWPTLWNLLHPVWLTFDIEVLGLRNVPTAYVIVAFIISLFARVSRLHDLVSDVFGIRERFDLYEVLIPLAGGAGLAIDPAKEARLRSKRDEIMSDVFYRYASSTNPVIDQHIIWTALDRWSWFWICIEAIVVFLAGFVTLISISADRAAAWVAVFVIIGILTATQVNRVCASTARAEIRTILEDPRRIAHIHGVFNAL